MTKNEMMEACNEIPWNDLKVAIHQNAVEHGWWEKDRSIAGILALIHSEISEALEKYRDGKQMVYCESSSKGCETAQTIPLGDIETPCVFCSSPDQKPEGIAVELADVLIRILDYCGYMGYDVVSDIHAAEDSAICEIKNWFTDTNRFDEYINLLHDDICFVSNFSKVEYAEKYIGIGFGQTIIHVVAWLCDHEINVHQVILMKHEYNKTRPYRHGNKVC